MLSIFHNTVEEFLIDALGGSFKMIAMIVHLLISTTGDGVSRIGRPEQLLRYLSLLP